MLRRSLAYASTGLLLGAATACAADAEEGSDEAAVDVVAAFYPLEFVAERVGGERVSVTGLAPPGVEAHDLELTPSQVADISQSDLVVFLTDFQPAVDAAVAEHAGDRGFDVAEVVPLLDNPDGHSHDHGHEDEDAREDDHDDDHDHDDDDDHGHGHEDDDHGHEDEEHGHDDEHGHEDEDEHGDDDHGHDHGDQDPHVWQDPDRLATIADELAAELSALDADHADEYAANAAALRDDLGALDQEYADGLAQCERREIVVSHAAFGYLADRYDLRQIAISGLSPEDEPSPQRLAEVIREAEAHGATTIFFEVLVSPAVAEVIATEVGAETAVLDPIEGLAPGSEEDYFSLMRANLDTLRGALDCT